MLEANSYFHRGAGAGREWIIVLSRMLGKEKPIDRWTLATLLVLFVFF